MTEKMTAMLTSLETLENKRKANQNTQEAEDTCKKAIAEVNKENIEARINALLDTMEKSGKGAMLKTFINDQYTGGFRLVQDKESNQYSAEPTNCYVKFSALDRASKTPIATKGNWNKYATIFYDNCLKHIADEKGEKAAFVKKPLTSEFVALRKEAKWDSVSMNALTEQLQGLVNDILPDAVAPKVIKADVKYLLTCLVSGKAEKKNTAGTLAVRKDASMEEFLFKMIYTRFNGLAYAFQNDSKATKQDTDLSDNGKAAEGGEVTAKTAHVEHVAKVADEIKTMAVEIAKKSA